MAMALEKGVALQVGRQPSVDAMPILGGSNTGVTALPASNASPIVAHMPSTGQVGAGARRMPSKVTEQLATEVIPPPTMGQMELPATLVAPTMAGATLPVEVSLMQAEVAAAMIGET